MCLDVHVCRLMLLCDLDMHLGEHLSVYLRPNVFTRLHGDGASASNKGDYFDGAGQGRCAGLIMT